MQKNINTDSKTEIIPVRCRKSEKEKLEHAAKTKGKSLSQYMLDSGIAGKERRVERDKRRSVVIIDNQETLNDIQRYIRDNDVALELKDLLYRLIEGEKNIWDC